MECLKAAIHNGADAIYLGGKSFGARAFAGNFTNEELKEAVNYAHLYGVKIYVTANTIIYNNEIKDFLEYIKYLYQIGVDALIMQDIGMISLVRKIFLDIEVHASTQCHNHNSEGIKLLKSLGVTRVVLDREMSLKEIENINIDIEKKSLYMELYVIHILVAVYLVLWMAEEVVTEENVHKFVDYHLN